MEQWRYEAGFSKNLMVEPYEKEEDGLREAFSLVDLCLFAACGRRDWKKDRDGEETGVWPQEEQVREEYAMAFGHVKSRMEATGRAGKQTRLSYLVKTFRLDEFQFLMVLFSLADGYSLHYGPLFSLLQEDAHKKRPSLGLVSACYGLVSGKEKPASLLPAQDKDFWLLFQKKEEYEDLPLLLRPLEARTRVWQFLSGQGAEGTLLGRTSETGPGTREEVCLYQDEGKRLTAAFRRLKERGERGSLLLWGRKGSGKTFLFRSLAGQLGKPYFLIHGKQALALSPKEQEQWLLELRLEKRLFFGIFGLDGVETSLTEQGKWLLEAVSALPGATVLLSEKELPLGSLGTGGALSIALKPPGPGEKIRMWEFFSRPYRLGPDVNLPMLGGQYVLNSGEVKAVLKTAELLSFTGGEAEIGKASLVEAVSQHNSRMLGESAVRIPCVFTWEDLVVEPEVQSQMEHIANQMKYRSVVADDWNFYRKTPYGRGTCALFYGPPGTGKTMAAQVIAGDLGLELYRIDLSQVVSKYIGETEKNISALFERAKDINALLFFDEADALFAKRSDVGDSNDRNANAETAHLLQCLEGYEGISILATNLKENIDEAFRRRIKFMVRFQLPDLETRRTLWYQMFPKEAPLAKDVDLDFFAERFELSGSAIKEIVFNAAYMAAADHGRIENRHIIGALRLNLEKMGKRVTKEELAYLGE